MVKKEEKKEKEEEEKKEKEEEEEKKLAHTGWDGVSLVIHCHSSD